MQVACFRKHAAEIRVGEDEPVFRVIKHDRLRNALHDLEQARTFVLDGKTHPLFAFMQLEAVERTLQLVLDRCRLAAPHHGGCGEYGGGKTCELSNPL
jgi:hypothetical protein